MKNTLNFLIPAILLIALFAGCSQTAEETTAKKYRQQQGKSKRDNISLNQAQMSGNDLDSVRMQLQQTEADLVAAESELSMVYEQLAETESQLMTRENQLEQYQQFQDRENELIAEIDQGRLLLLERDERLREERELQKQLFSNLQEQLESDQIKISTLLNRISVRLDERVLFDSGEAFIKASGFKILNKIGSVFKKIKDKHIQVEGHTDNRPIGEALKPEFPTNWELSTARATSVTRYLVDIVKIEPSRISVSGYSAYQPVAENNTLAGQQANRRVEFSLLPLRREVIE